MASSPFTLADHRNTFCDCCKLGSDAELRMSQPAAFKPLTRMDVAAILSVSVRTVENWRKRGRIPMSIDIEGRTYWHPVTFYSWLNATLTEPTDGVAAQQFVQEDSASRPRPRNPQSVQGAVRAMRNQKTRLAAMADQITEIACR